jgi:hypothetical protein
MYIIFEPIYMRPRAVFVWQMYKSESTDAKHRGSPQPQRIQPTSSTLKMASPFAVIPNPADQSSQLLYFLVGTSQQIGMEVRPQVQTQTYVHYKNNSIPQGVIANPGAFAATTFNGVVS